MASTLNPDTRLRRREAAEALTRFGIPVRPSTLATWAVRPPRGGGPLFYIFGRTVLYRWGDLLAWAEGRMSPPRASTSEHKTANAA